MPALANQHYVWAHYLKAWAEDRFFCWRQSEKNSSRGSPVAVSIAGTQHARLGREDPIERRHMGIE
jgi:hypothetical protein